MADKGQFVYNELGVTRAMRNIPRFGHSEKFALLFSGNKNETVDYVAGLLFAGCFVLAFFLAWTVILLVLPCLGRKMVGFWSGRPMHVPYKSRKPFVVRTAFVLSGLIVITFAVLSVTQGLTKFRTGVDTVIIGAVDLNQLLIDAGKTVNNIITLGQENKDLQGAVAEDLTTTGFCQNQVSLEQLGNETQVDWEGVVSKAQIALAEVNLTSGQFVELRDSIRDIQESTQILVDTTNNIDIGDWQSLIVIIPYVIVVFLFLVDVILAWRDVSHKYYRYYQCFVTWFLLPLFFIMVIITYICCAGVAIAASGNADFCSGEGPEDALPSENSPSGTILEILIMNGWSPDSLEYQIVSFYLLGCSSANPFIDVLNADNITNAVGAFQELEAKIDETTVERLVELCGQDFVQAQQVISNVTNVLDELGNLAVSALDVLRCDRILPIYFDTVNYGTCSYSIKGVTWTFCGFLVVACFGMVMLTLRSARFPTVFTEAKDFEESTPAMDAVEVEYEPYQQEQTVQGGEEKHGLQGEQTPDPYEANAPLVTAVAAGAAAGAAATISLNESNSFATANTSEQSPTVHSNTFSSGHDDDWLNIDKATTPTSTASP